MSLGSSKPKQVENKTNTKASTQENKEGGNMHHMNPWGINKAKPLNQNSLLLTLKMDV